MWAYISLIKELIYSFSLLCQQVEHLENIDNERSGREDERLLVNPQWMEGSQDKRESQRSHVEMENFLNNLQELLNAHDNRTTDEGVIMG